MTVLQSTAQWLGRLMTVVRSGAPRPIPTIDAIETLTVLKLDAIGDFVLSTAFLRLLADRYPAKEVNLVVRRPLGALARHQFPKWNIVELPIREVAWRNIFRQPEAKKKLVNLPRTELMVDLRAYRDYSDTILASWVPADCKLGLRNAYGSSFRGVTFPQEDRVYDQLSPPIKPLPGECSDLANHRRLSAIVFGIEGLLEHAFFPRLIIGTSERTAMRTMLSNRFNLASDHPYCVVCPGTSTPLKEYPTDLLASALESAFASSPLPLIVAGTDADYRTTQPLIARLSSNFKVIDVVGYFTLQEHVTLIAEGELAITMDSCHVHIAGAVGTPAVAVLGGGQFGDFGPWGECSTFRWLSQYVDCYGCSWICPYPRPKCIDEVSPARFADAIIETRKALSVRANGTK